MKVQIKNLEPNPYRDMDNYPVDQFKIESLKNSIEQTGFWDNIVARPKPGVKGKFQLAYGHHRLLTIKELGITEIDIPVKDLDDFTMIQIMANENRIEYKTNYDVTLETVKAARDFLNAELAKYKKWEDAPRGLVDLLDLDKRSSFGNLKTKGVGTPTVKNFLGDNWKEWEIKDSLDTLDSKDVDRKALSVFKIPKMSNAFKKAIRKVNEEKKEKNGSSIAVKDQEKLAEIVKERITPKDGSRPKIFSAGGGSYDAIMETLVRQEVDNTNEYDTAINEIVLKLKNIEAESNKLANQMGLLNAKFDEMEMTEIRSLDTTLMMSSFSRLLENLNGLTKRLGFEINNLMNK